MRAMSHGFSWLIIHTLTSGSRGKFWSPRWPTLVWVYLRKLCLVLVQVWPNRSRVGRSVCLSAWLGLKLGKRRRKNATLPSFRNLHKGLSKEVSEL